MKSFKDRAKKILASIDTKTDEKLAKYGYQTPEPLRYQTGKEVTPFSLIDQVTGAPMRTAVQEMQKGNFGKEAFVKTLEAARQDPGLAPSGADIAKNAGVDTSSGLGQAVGVGFDLALDPTNFLPSKGAIAGVAAVGKIQDISKEVRGVEKVAKEIRSANEIKLESQGIFNRIVAKNPENLELLQKASLGNEEAFNKLRKQGFGRNVQKLIQNRDFLLKTSE